MSTNNQNQPYNYQMPPRMPVQGGPPYPPRQQIYASVRVTKNKFLTFVFACLPGAGQMYHGLMKKGASLMLLFFGIFGISIAAYIGVLNILLPVIWFYSFFDTVNRMNMSLDELGSLKDNYPFFGDHVLPRILGGGTLSRLLEHRHRWIGWGLILLAGWISLNLVFGQWYDRSFLQYIMPEDIFYFIQEGVQLLPTLLIPLLCILIGVRLIKGANPSKTLYDEYTIPRETKASSGPAEKRSAFAEANSPDANDKHPEL